MKKSILSIVAAICCFGLSELKGQVFDWVVPVNATADDAGEAIAVDDSGNVYTTGYFRNSADFVPGSPYFYLNSRGNTDGFVTKYSASGNFIWAKRIGGDSYDSGLSIALDDSANVYVSGTFSDSVDFDPGPGTHYIYVQGWDSFILKLNSAGSFVWVRTTRGGAISVFSNEARSICVDNAGDICVTGKLWGIVDFYTDTDTVRLMNNANLSACFILKLDPAGNLLFANVTPGAMPQAISSDDFGNTYVIGSFHDTVDFDAGPGTQILIGGSSYSEDFFIEKLDAAGNLLWVKKSDKGKPGSTCIGYSIVQDDEGSVYATGTFTGKIDFNPGMDSSMLSSSGQEDVFILKLDSTGNFIYAKKIGGVNEDHGESIVVDHSKNVYLTGSVQGSVDMDPGPGIFSVTTNTEDIFLLKLDSMGNYLRSNVFIGGFPWADLGKALCLDNAGNLFITGYYDGSLDFDPGPASASYIGHVDIFVLKFEQCSTSAGATLNPVACHQYTAPDGRILSATGTYQVVIPNSARCDSTIEINLTISPDVSVSQSGLTLSANSSIATYQWIDCGNNFLPIAGETNQSYTAIANGSYAVIVTENGCTDTSDCYPVIGVGIDDSKQSQDGVTFYPNPVTMDLYVKFDQPSTSQEMKIYNLLGEELLNTNCSGNCQEVIMDMSSLAPGIYVLNLTSEKGNIAFKLVKQ